MTPRMINEQSFKEREQKIIDAALELVEQLGIENLTMDKVVAQVPFSKGTVYKHFLGKEDLVLAISHQAIFILADLFIRAANFDGCAREKMLLMNLSYLIYAILHPALFKSVICSKSPNVYEKCSEQRLQVQEQLEMKLLSAIHGIIEQAIADKSFVLPAHMDIQQVCFATWSMGYGTIALLSNEVEQCSGRNSLVVEQELFNQSNLLFDGLQWLPLTKDKDYKHAIQTALQQVYSEELTQMKQLGRELKL